MYYGTPDVGLNTDLFHNSNKALTGNSIRKDVYEHYNMLTYNVQRCSHVYYF